MRVKELEYHMERAARLCEKLGVEPGTPADRIILKPGQYAPVVNPTIRQLKRHQTAAAKLLQRGLKRS